MGGAVDSASAMLIGLLPLEVKCQQGPSVCKGKGKSRQREGGLVEDALKRARTRMKTGTRTS